jgi:hypothetical protein
MDFDWQKFINPAQFSNANYFSELNPANGMTSVRDAMQGQQTQSVPPPENVGDYISQKFGPIQNMASAVAPAMNQLSSGNVMGAVNTMKQARNPAQPTATMQQPAPMTGYDYTHGLDY